MAKRLTWLTDAEWDRLEPLLPRGPAERIGWMIAG